MLDRYNLCELADATFFAHLVKAEHTYIHNRETEAMHQQGFRFSRLEINGDVIYQAMHTL